MNAKTIITLMLLLIIPPFTDLARAEEVADAQKRPDLTNAASLKKILEEALLNDLLKERGPEGEKVFYAPDAQIPYTGWAKKLHDNGKLKSLGTYKNGKLEGLITKWHENGQKVGEVTYKDGKQEGLATMWNENGVKEAEFTYKEGKQEGPYAKWYENGKKAEEGIYKNGQMERFHSNGT